MTAREGLSVGLESGAVSVMRANVLSGLRWGTPPACGHPLKRGISLFVLSYYRANEGMCLMGFLVILRCETDWLYRDCFDGDDGRV